MSTSSSAEDGGWAAPWFAGRRVLVTGGSSGIGAAVSRAFAGAGAEVIATGVAAAELEALAGDGDFADVDLRLLDVRDKAAVAALAGGLPGLDVLVNCAGVIRRGGQELDPEIFALTVEVNLTGSMRMCAAARPLLARSGRGAIVNLASIMSFFGGVGVPGYAASKGGVAQMTKALAIAYAEDRVRVNAVAPGWIVTPLTEPLRADAARNAAVLARTPLHRWGEAGEVASAVLFLCSPAASYVTGAVLMVDGGYSIY